MKRLFVQICVFLFVICIGFLLLNEPTAMATDGIDARIEELLDLARSIDTDKLNNAIDATIKRRYGSDEAKKVTRFSDVKFNLNPPSENVKMNDFFYAFVFVLRDHNNNDVICPCTVDIRICDSDGEELYSSIIDITTEEYGWFTDGYTSYYPAVIRIPKKEVMTGSSVHGTLYYRIYLDDYWDLGECKMAVDNLPVKTTPTPTPVPTPTPTQTPIPTQTPDPSTIGTTGKSGDFEYYVLDDGTAEITRYNGYRAEVLEIPAELDGFIVTAIGNEAFYMEKGVKKVVIPDSVKIIWDRAFYYSDLEEVNLGNGVQEICKQAFAECDRLRSIVIPDSVKMIGTQAFSDCDVLLNVKIGNGTIVDGTTRIGGSVFENCKRLKSVVIGENVEYIGYQAFVSCDRLESVVLGEKVIEIGDRAFANLYSLESLRIPQSVQKIGDNTFANCKKLKLIFQKGSYAEKWATEKGLQMID